MPQLDARRELRKLGFAVLASVRFKKIANERFKKVSGPGAR